MIQQKQRRTPSQSEHNALTVGERFLGAFFFLLGSAILWVALQIGKPGFNESLVWVAGALLMATAVNVFARARTLACWLLLVIALPFLAGGITLLLASQGILDKTSSLIWVAIILFTGGLLVGAALWIRRLDA